jgi:tetratricopeptide (TPR) repeat protein
MAESPDPADRGQGSVAGSIPYYERAKGWPAQHFLAHAYENAGRMKEAEASASAYAAANPGVPHAVHMHGHELRRLGRITEAIARFEAADKLERDYIAREKISAEFDWHQAHNVDLLAASYQYTGQMKKAEALFKQNFNTPTNLLVQAVNKREWPAFLLARNRPAEALAAAQTLFTHPNPVVQATGHIEAGFAQLAMNKPGDGAASSNAALRALRAAQGGQGLAAINLEALQGEFLLRTGQRDKGRQVMERAAGKWRSLPGPDAWTQSLFRLEALARSARAVGDWALAARIAQLMLEHDPNYAGTHYALALVAQNNGNTATARREFDLALKAWANADKDLAELQIAAKR